MDRTDEPSYIDISPIKYISSTGIEGFLKLGKEYLEKTKQKANLVVPTKHIQTVLETMRLYTLFNIYDSHDG